MPFTRAALRNLKVRHELGADEVAGGVVQRIADDHQRNLAAARSLGLNTNVVEAELPRRFEIVAPPTCEEEVIRKLIKASAAKQPCGSTVGRSPSTRQ